MIKRFNLLFYCLHALFNLLEWKRRISLCFNHKKLQRFNNSPEMVH